MTKKITKKENFATLLTLTEVKANPQLVEFINHEIELLNRKGSSTKGLTPTQKANEVFKQAILDEMLPNKLYTITELQKEVPSVASAELSNQRVSSLVKQLKDEGKVIRTEEKGKAYFTKC
jgi:hypothetical protein